MEEGQRKRVEWFDRWQKGKYRPSVTWAALDHDQQRVIIAVADRAGAAAAAAAAAAALPVCGE